MQTKLISKTKYHHTFDHPTWIKGKADKNGYIVLASSGVDSTTTLAYLSSLKKDVIAVYMDYGSKTCEAELIQLRSICEELNVPLIVKDVKDIFKNSKSALLSEDIDDTTGSIVESTSSWVANRNELFMSIVATMAESMILNNEYAKITITGGFPIVSDETIYPDCATRFTDKMNSVLNVSTLSGSEDRIKWENPLKYLNKTETVFLLEYLTPGLINKTVSCYNPKIIDGAVYQCAKNGQPACGPGILTKIGIIKAGIEDNRLFYEYDTDQTLQSCEGYEKEDLNIDEILRKIVI